LPQLVRTDDVTLSVQVEGSGSPVVLIHGWSMSGRFFQRQLPALAASHQVVVPDMRGHGRSEAVLHGHTIPSYAADLQAVLVALGVDRPVMVGWSMGAIIGFEFLRQNGPRSLSGLVIVDQPPSDFAWEGYEFGAATLAGLHESNERIQTDQRAVVYEFIRRMLHEPDDGTVDWMAAEALRVPPAIASAVLIDQTLRDYRDFLPQIEVPTLVLFGGDDKLTNPRAGQYIADRIPHAQLRIFANSSHCPFWEEADAFNEEVTTFADRVAAD
jgi:non-heme chloroperoxidase